MPITGKRPQIFRIRKYLPANRVQQWRIKVPAPPYRPIRMMRRDVIKRGMLKWRPEWYTLHRRMFPGTRTTSKINPLELRAIPENIVKGFLEERIIYLELVKRGFVPGIDFTFQTSLEGGRIEMGGLVADFVLEDQRLILNPIGPTHYTTIGKAKDREQAAILASMGFTVIFIPLRIVHDADLLEEWFRRFIDPGGVSILDPFDTYTDDVVSWGPPWQAA